MSTKTPTDSDYIEAHDELQNDIEVLDSALSNLKGAENPGDVTSSISNLTDLAIAGIDARANYVNQMASRENVDLAEIIRGGDDEREIKADIASGGYDSWKEASEQDDDADDEGVPAGGMGNWSGGG